jgi:hypothetical protein
MKIKATLATTSFQPDHFRVSLMTPARPQLVPQSLDRFCVEGARLNRVVAHERSSGYKAKSLLLRTLHTNGGRGGTLLAATFLLCAGAMQAQGILTVTPGRTATTLAGTGTPSYTGDGGAATSSTLASPGAVAYDTTGNLYIADTKNHVIRKVTPAGTITTIAGTGVEGFNGDGIATASQLDTPTGIAVDAIGTVYVADSHNHRIRRITGTTIATIAGTGIAGYSGDGAAATAAQLALPSAVAVDASGGIYIADTNNHRIREITGTTITTIAGSGEEFYAGDGAAATAAALDSPTGVAVSSTGVVYIADRLNQRIRTFTPGGNITTVAGSGTASFAGSFSGDGANATTATLSRPTGVSVASNSNIYVADTDNQRIRQVVNGGAIVTVVGSGGQGFGADAGPATVAVLDTPKFVAQDVTGNLAISDTMDNRIRSTALPTLIFGSVVVGVPSSTQSVTLSNTGNASITLATPVFAGMFSVSAGGTCAAAPITLTAGASCTQLVAFVPSAVGVVSGSVVFDGNGVVPQVILLSGSGTIAGTGVALQSNVVSPLAGQSVTLTATVRPSGVLVPTGTVSFYSNGVLLAQNVALIAGAASLTTITLPDGADLITAVYSGSTNFEPGTSNAISLTVNDFQLAIGGGGSTGSGSSGSFGFSIVPGSSGTISFVLQPLEAVFPYPISFSATGLPAGSTYSFNPTTVTLGTAPVTVTMTVQVPLTASLRWPTLLNGGTATLALLLIPFGLRRSRNLRSMKHLKLGCFLLVSLIMVGSLFGCGTGSGLFGNQPKTYSLTVTATATEANGTQLSRSTAFPLTIQ